MRRGARIERAQDYDGRTTLREGTPIRWRRNAREAIARRWRALEPRFDYSEAFPSIEDELGPFRHYFRGRVLNAGAGDRDISALVDGELVTQDIAEGWHNENTQILSPLHEIPFEDGYFDAIVCNAVLEHVANPDDVLAEFQRVCRPGGTLYLTVPFMQPEHLDPTDYQRYTLDGLKVRVESNGFTVIEAGGVHSVYTTLAWVAQLWLSRIPGARGKALRWALLPPLRHRLKHSRRYVHELASAYRVVARRDGGTTDPRSSG